MAASTLFFKGRLISVPGSYAETDSSGLEEVGLGANGIVALLGTAEGGKPWNAVDTGDTKGNLQTATNPQRARDLFRSGDLKEGAGMLFEPAQDEDVPSGAAEVIFVKVNPAKKSAAAFDNADGESLILESSDWGYFTTQISTQIGTGSGAIGKLITLTLEDTEEVFDQVGGDPIFTLQYAAAAPAEGFTTVAAEITNARLKTLFTRDQIGLDNEITTPVVAGQAIELISNSALDVAVRVRIYGTDASNATQSAVYLLAGTALVTTTETWNEFHGAEIIAGALAGTLTIQNIGAASTIATLAPAGTDIAIEYAIDHAVTGSIVVVADAATTKRITLFGLSGTGSFQTEVLVLNGTTPVSGAALWTRIDGFVLGALEAARTLTVSGVSVDAIFGNLATIQKMADKFNGTPGYAMAVSIGNPAAYASTSLDRQASTSIKGPAVMTAYGDLAAIISKLNSSSRLVVASAGSVASGPPSNTIAPVFLTGGNEGSAVPGEEAIPKATPADWQGAIDLLTKVRINSLVGITGDPSIHAAINAHCKLMDGIGKSERDAAVGAMNVALDGVPTKAEIKAQIIDLNSQHIRVCGQAIERYDSNGDRREFLSPFQAVVAIGMQAGSAVGTSLTRKIANVLKIRQDQSWNPTDDGEELIQAGLFMMETVDNIGRRVVRNITSHLSSSDISKTEASVNEARNFSVYNFRTAMETAVGKPGFGGSVADADAVAKNTLGLLVGVSLVSWKSLSVELIRDVLEVSADLAVVLPINFVKSVLHLVTSPQSAAS